DPLVRGHAAVRLQPGRRPHLARPARRLGAADGRVRVAGRRIDAHALPRRPAPAQGEAVGRRRFPMDSLRRRRPRVRARRLVRLPRQFRLGVGSAAAEGRGPYRQQRPRRRCGSAGHDGLVFEPTRSKRGRTMKSLRRIAAAVVVAGLVALCATAAAVARTNTVTISVASLIPGSTQAAVDQFNQQVAEFEKANPTIKVKPVEYQWTGPTFAAKLAAGTLPTVFEVPFTDARTLGENGQLADLTSYVKKLPYFSKYNPAVLAEGTDSKGQIIALPKGAYVQALHYNRSLFKEAGLDPNKPPTTWTQLRADAKAIAAKTGKTGYAEMAKDDNTAGWILTTVVYSLGGRMEVGTGTSAKATLDNPKTIQALNLLQATRWTDNSMGSNFSYSWGDINQAFAACSIGMYISGADVYTNLVQASKNSPRIYRLSTIPLAKNKTAGVLGGGTE